MTKYKSNTYFHCFFHVFVSVWMKFGSVKHCYDDLLLMGQISAIAFTYLDRVNGFLLVTKSSSFNAKMRKTLFSILKITLRDCTNLFLGSLFAVKRLMLTPSLTLATNRASSLAFFGFVIFLTFLRASLSDSLSDARLRNSELFSTANVGCVNLTIFCSGGVHSQCYQIGFLKLFR